MLENKKEFMYDFDGSCAPGGVWGGLHGTFSVGIFQWLPKSSNKGLKRSPVKYRVSGSTHKAETIYSRARVLCNEFNKGIFPKKKSESI